MSLWSELPSTQRRKGAKEEFFLLPPPLALGRHSRYAGDFSRRTEENQMQRFPVIQELAAHEGPGPGLCAWF